MIFAFTFLCQNENAIHHLKNPHLQDRKSTISSGTHLPRVQCICFEIGITSRNGINTVKCTYSMSKLSYFTFYANMPLYSSLTIYCTRRVQNQFIAVLVVISINAKLYCRWILHTKKLPYSSLTIYLLIHRILYIFNQFDERNETFIKILINTGGTSGQNLTRLRR